MAIKRRKSFAAAHKAEWGVELGHATLQTFADFAYSQFSYTIGLGERCDAKLAAIQHAALTALRSAYELVRSTDWPQTKHPQGALFQYVSLSVAAEQLHRWARARELTAWHSTGNVLIAHLRAGPALYVALSYATHVREACEGGGVFRVTDGKFSDDVGGLTVSPEPDRRVVAWRRDANSILARETFPPTREYPKWKHGQDVQCLIAAIREDYQHSCADVEALSESADAEANDTFWENLDLLDRRVLEFLIADGFNRAESVADSEVIDEGIRHAPGITQSLKTVQNRLTQLANRGLIESVKRGPRSGYYIPAASVERMQKHAAAPGDSVGNIREHLG
ncbi:MAG: hypothetical protein SF069_10570 [Phycisphaerae bacterium]|nr:hypothetical protein [Phycisphaerae bacterium]